MHDIHLFLKNLTNYFDVNRTSADQLHQKIINQLHHQWDLNELINHLTEICTECRQTRESNVFDNTHDSWEYFAKILSIEHLLAFFTGLIELTSNDERNFLHKKLVISVCRTYVLLLTSPGAKIFGAFQSDLLRKVFKTFELIKQMGNYNERERDQLLVLLSLLLEDFQLYLKHVSFEEYEDLQVQFVEAIAAIMEFHHEKGFLNKYSFQIQELCYTTLENTCLPIHNTDITASLAIVLNGTACLTRFYKPCAGSHLTSKYKLITDWFVEMLRHYPEQTSATLNCYIQAILTDSDITCNRDLLNRYFDICAQYDAEMVRICGQSICEFLKQLAQSKEPQHRGNCVELIGRMLARNTRCDWELFRSELPKIPREIHLLKILLQKIYDSNNAVAMKAMNAFLKIVKDGNVICKAVISKLFFENLNEHETRNATENVIDEMDGINDSIDLQKTQEQNKQTNDNETTVDANDNAGANKSDDDCISETSSCRRSEPIDYTKSIEYKELEEEINQNILCAIRLQMKNSSALVRRAVISMLDFLGTTNKNIDNLLLSHELRQLFIDQSPMVRGQLVKSLDNILNSRPANDAAINAWIKIVLDLANDIDAKVMESVIESFKRNIFDRIEVYEQSPSLTHVFPWRLLRCMLNCRDSPDFRVSVQKWMNQNLINARTLSKIETHLDTNNATEAWILLAIVAPNIKGHNPERVSQLLLTNLKLDMTHTVENCYIQLEVLSFWLQYLKNPSKNEIKRLMTETLLTGGLRPRNINRTFGICYKLSVESGDKDRRTFIKKIRNSCESYIFANRNSMFVQNLCDDRFISYIYLYSELGSILESTLHSEIIEFYFSFLDVVGKGQVLTVQNDSMLSDKVNCILSVLTGLSSFSQDICARFVPHLGKILRIIDHTDVSFTAIKCLGYLCKKNTAMVEKIIPFILMKTQHHYSNIREFAMKTLATLILEDYLKFRGNLLVYILAGILDQEREIKELAIELILKYTLEKSDIFLRTCLLECPFVFNGCACFGQGNSGLYRTNNILKGPTKRGAREFIYQYLIKKIDPIYLYMYFGNIGRLSEVIQKDPSKLKSLDMQYSIADFLFICSEICIANEKQKKNLEKIVKESHDGEGINIENDEFDLNAAAPTENADNDKKGRGGKKNMPTLTQSLSTVEKIVPFIASIDEMLRTINSELFTPVLNRLCINMCLHFESLIEYAQPRKFWQKHLGDVKKAQAAAQMAKQNAKKALAKARRDEAREMQPPRAPSVQPATPRASRKVRENDSGHFTLEDNEVDDVISKRSSSRASKRASSRASVTSQRSISRMTSRAPSRAMSRSKKRMDSIPSDSDDDDDDMSDTSSIFSELSVGTAASTKRRKTQNETATPKRSKKSPAKTPSSRKSSRKR